MIMHSQRVSKCCYLTLVVLTTTFLPPQHQPSLADETDLSVLGGRVGDAPAVGMMPRKSDQLIHTIHAALTVYDLPDLRAVLADDNCFGYEYEKVFDYYIIQAWRGLDEPVPAYTPEMVKRHTELVGKLPWVRPTKEHRF